MRFDSRQITFTLAILAFLFIFNLGCNDSPDPDCPESEPTPAPAGDDDDSSEAGDDDSATGDDDSAEHYSDVSLRLWVESSENAEAESGDTVGFLSFGVEYNGDGGRPYFEELPFRMIGDLNGVDGVIEENSLGEALEQAHPHNSPGRCHMSYYQYGMSDVIRVLDGGEFVIRNILSPHEAYPTASIICDLNGNVPYPGYYSVVLAVELLDASRIKAIDEDGLPIHPDNIVIEPVGLNPNGIHRTVTVTAPEPPACGFQINEGFGNFVNTQTQATYNVVGQTYIQVPQGSPAVLTFDTNADICGGIDLSSMFLWIEDLVNTDWLHTVSDSATPMFLLHGSTPIPPFASYTMDYAPGGDELHYDWNDGRILGSSFNPPSNFPGITVNAGTSESFSFVFTATSYAPVGTTFTMNLGHTAWFDVATGTPVYDYSGGYGQITTVEIVAP